MAYISKEGFDKLKEELDLRKIKIRKEIAQRIEEAKALGDLSENAEYSSAKDAQAFNEGRVLELEKIVREATIIGLKQKESGKVQMGSTIKVQPLAKDGKKENNFFTIVGPYEANPIQGKISNESPLGRAFLGRQIGDVIEIKTPRGMVKYKIISID